MFNNLEAAREEALFLREVTSQSQCIVTCKVNNEELLWVTKKYYADKNGITYLWDTTNKIERTKNSSFYWSHEEKELVLKEYQKKGAKELSRRLGRSATGVNKMAAKLGVKYLKGTVNEHKR